MARLRIVPPQPCFLKVRFCLAFLLGKIRSYTVSSKRSIPLWVRAQPSWESVSASLSSFSLSFIMSLTRLAVP
ncbi:hypothetical protein DHL47_07935 [Streptococcus panodentis]|uniref:Uncharacterized protein n=1 Tax=Streptococcus panodentis TaxID=1581472 RepID=A0ABS5AXJ0_9STRE|nr:hypothetical protein [Streptococcus panodentis]